MGAFTVDIPPLARKPDVVRELAQVDGVCFIHDFVGTLLWATFFYENDQDFADKKKLMQEIAGGAGLPSHIPYPPCTASLTRPEAELVLRLLKGQFSSYGNLARELETSVRTLERRISKLVQEGAVLSLPRMDYKAISRSIPADLVVLFKDPESARSSVGRIMPLIGDYVILASLWDVAGMCSLILPDVTSMTGLAEKVKRVDGVAMARVEIVREHIDQVQIFEAPLVRWMKEKGLRVVPLQAQHSKRGTSDGLL